MNLMTCFNLLGLSPEADAAQAKRAYKAQVRQWHPDKFPAGSATKARAEEQLKQINIAYARVREHLSRHRPEPAQSPPAEPDEDSTTRTDARDRRTNTRSWIDHLFDTLNAFAGGRQDNPSSASSAKSRPAGRKRFGQVLDEMAGGRIASRKDRPVRKRKGAASTAAAYRRPRRRGSSVGAVGGTESPGPVRPVGRVRGIGRSR
jgi:curved DNA-binding protein CbpA